MTLGERIKRVRKALDLTQQEFAERIGMKRNSIAQIEMGRNTSDQTVVSICREFDVNETWLRTGEGDVFVKVPNTAIRQLSNEFYLDSFDEALVEEYLHLTPNQRKTFRTFFYRVLVKSIGNAKPEALLEAETGYSIPEDVEALVKETNKSLTQQQRSNTQQEPEMLNVIYITRWFPQPMSAGTGTEAGSDYPEELELTKRPPRGTSYVAPVSGDSMEPTYHDGDKLFIRACEEIEIGQIGVFLMDGKQWVKEQGDSVLISHNPDYEPIPMRDNIRCQGLVLGVCDESYFE